ncbi:MAG TPA: serine/threonine-protein kinase [Polyangia bacterium]|nr:serine/threonine-protein kinase [Polyangia bacterium]
MPGIFQTQRFGQYTLTAKLGRGGMADVFRARREGAAGFERTVVVKKILGGHTEDPAFVEMFINEAKIAARLTHPNIVQVHELGEENGEFYIVMEYVRGRDLLRLLRALAEQSPESPAVPPLAAGYIAREVCRGLGHAHELTDDQGTARPIVHRDVSPQNIMISYDGHVKLVDFGIAKALDTMKDETRTGALKGKFAYMAPELLEGQSPGAQADIFSTGVVLHEMLTGRRLFKGPTDYETLQKVQNQRIPPPSQWNRKVPPELDAIVLQALDRDRAKRYARAAHFARDLDVFLQAQRFTVEDMAELMARIFPVELRDLEVAQDAPSSASGSASAASASQAPARNGRPSLQRSQGRPRPQPPAPQRSRLLWAVSTILLCGVGLILATPLWRRPKVAPRTITVAQSELTPHVEVVRQPDPLPTLPAGAGPIYLDSEPANAQIFDGPKLLGTAPLSLPIERGGARLITLVHAGYDDLSYTVQSGDAPSLTLRLSRKKPVAHHAAAPSTQATPSTKDKKGRPRTDSVDDGAPAPRVPQVTPIDD